MHVRENKGSFLKKECFFQNKNTLVGKTDYTLEEKAKDWKENRRIIF